MSVKVVVLYPHPVDPEAFEKAYHGEHMPLMHRLIGSKAALPTFKVAATPRGPAPYYRQSEIHFSDMAALTAFASSEDAAVARASSEKVSTGGRPVVFVCVADS